MKTIKIETTIEKWPIRKTFKISRGSKTEAVVVVAEVSDGTHSGRGECVPYAHFGESVESVKKQIDSWKGKTRAALQRDLPRGAARNALDCALWDLKAKQTGQPAYQLAGVHRPKPLMASYTISLDTPSKMAAAAKRVADWPLLKIKLGSKSDPRRLEAIRAVAPKARLIVDANEGWTIENLSENLEACKRFGVELVEQPLPAGRDAALAAMSRVVPVCADESAFDRASIPALRGKYDAVNVKLDKAGGLTEAFATAALARQLGLKIMVGCIVGTSLSIAPAFLVAQHADYADLDGPLLLAKDRDGGIRCADGLIYPPEPVLWG